MRRKGEGGHSRYFMKQVADTVLIFKNETVMYYPFGYEHYLEQRKKLYTP